MMTVFEKDHQNHLEAKSNEIWNVLVESEDVAEDPDLVGIMRNTKEITKSFIDQIIAELQKDGWGYDCKNYYYFKEGYYPISDQTLSMLTEVAGSAKECADLLQTRVVTDPTGDGDQE
jgi:hypothetical protein